MCSLHLFAQGTGTSSPYSRYGYGTLADQSISAGYAMGGLGYGLRKPASINPLNPASYSGVDSLTFLFDMGVDFQSYNMKDAESRQSGSGGNIKNINMLFSLGKGFAFSGGILPVSYVGYHLGRPYGPGSNAQIEYTGTGGLHKVYGGLAYEYKNFSIGTNLGYLFGNLEYYTLLLPEGGTVGVSQDSVVISSHDFSYSVGVQQIVPINKTTHAVLGVVYTPKLKMAAKGREANWINGELNYVGTSGSYEMAQSIGAGVSLVKDARWTVGADVLWENWADAQIKGVTDSLNNRLKYTVGGEFIPNARSRNYLNRIQYRLGGYYANSYITTDKGTQYDEYGVRLGFGLPVYNRSVLHVAFDYSKIAPSVKADLTENYFKVTLNYTFNEIWFRKWRLY